MIGMWKAFAEMEALGWIGPKRPKMIAVQAEGCQPVVRAFEAGAERSQFWEGAVDRRQRIARAEAAGRFSGAQGRARKRRNRDRGSGCAN